jgi:hypothetical protein
MKTFKTLARVIGAAVLGTAGLYAQATVADIPFDFTVQSATMHAGHYKLWATSMSSQLMQISNAQTGQSVLVLAPESGSTPVNDKTTAKLIFHRYGDRYFLSEVRTPGSIRSALPSKMEREYRARYSEKERASISIPLVVAP